MNTAKRILICFVAVTVICSLLSGCNFGVIRNEPPTKAEASVTAITTEAETTAEATTKKEKLSGENDTSVTTTQSSTEKDKTDASETTASSTTGSQSTTTTTTKASEKDKEKETEKNSDKKKKSKKKSKKKRKKTVKKKRRKKKRRKKKKKHKKTPAATTTTKKAPAPTSKVETACYLTIEYTSVKSGAYILNAYECPYSDGDTVYDVLKRSCSAKGIPFGEKDTGYGKYIFSINGIDESYAGYKKGGWTYRVNGSMVMKSVDKCSVNRGDRVVFSYVLVKDF